MQRCDMPLQVVHAACACRNGYGVDPPGQANMAICSGAVGQRYNALAFTLEMPFKDTNYSREPVRVLPLLLPGAPSWAAGPDVVCMTMASPHPGRF